MDQSELYRAEAVSGQAAKWLGDIVTIKPVSFRLITSMAVGVVALIACFAMFGSYTQRHTVTGQLVPNIGVIKVFSPQTGVVIEKKVVEGQKVEKGDMLYLVSSERQSSDTNGGLQETISRQVTLRQQSLREEIIQTNQLHLDEEKTLRKKIDGLLAEQANVIHQVTGQKMRVKLAQDSMKRVTKLLAQGYISAEMAQQRESEFLEQKNRLEALERDRISIAREIMVQRAELAALPLRQNSQLAQIKRLLTNTDQEWAESEGKRRIAVIAPESGIATTVTAEVGQTVDGTRSMVSVIPNGAKLQAYLYAPSRAIGFVKEGDPVLLRYQAYPYQKFGHVRGTIVGVSRIALLPGEITGIQMSNFTTGEPFYRIIVSLRSQSINTYGKRQELQAGMLLDADILLEERKIYEWALEPLYSLTGKL